MIVRYADFFDANAAHRQRGKRGLQSWLCRDAEGVYIVTDARPGKELVVLATVQVAYTAEPRRRGKQPPPPPTDGPPISVDTDDPDR